MLEFILNGMTVQAEDGETVLHAARRLGIPIPTLCDHPDLTPFGGCRLCIVDVKGSRTPLAACTLLAQKGLIVKTDTPRLHKQRRAVLRMLLSTYYEKRVSPDTELMQWAKVFRLRSRALRAQEPHFPIDSDPNPFIRVDLNKCILCTRCIRACEEIQGRFVWTVSQRGYESHLVAGLDQPLLDARCESCGACVAYCPTGALDSKLSYNLGAPDKKVTTICAYCGVGCTLDLNVKDGRVIRVTSNPGAPVNGMHLCVKGRFGYDFIHHSTRLKKPQVREYLLKGEKRVGADRGAWVEVEWDTALDIVARKMTEVRSAYGPGSIGVLTSAKCTNEENYLMNKLARQVIGTNSIDHCARL
jgi:formate dehydrogenase major subunit/formate dehydrogenase alpha subunit